MKRQLTFLALALSGTLAAQTFTPIAAPGHNLDVIAETSPAAGSTTGSLGAGDYVLYNVDYGTVFSTGTGLPNNGLITNGTRSYQLQPYDQDNAVFLTPGASDSLELTTPASYSAVSLLGFSTEGEGQLLVVLLFTDGSGTVYPNLVLPEWTGSAGEVVSGFGRTVRTTDTPDLQANEPRMFAVDLSLTCEDQAKLLEEILIINTTPSPTIKTVVMAVSGDAALQGTVTTTEPACNGGTDGTATVETTGGVAPVSYEWSTSPAQTTAAATGLAAGTYTVIVSDGSGCPPDTLTAVVGEPDLISTGQFFAICDGESIQVGTNVYTTDGVYTDVLTAANGCDSVVTTTIEIITVNNGAVLSGADTLTAVAANAQYQWLDCGNNYAVIAGETDQVFIAPANGNYAVAVTENGCTDTSACVAVTVVSVDESQAVSVVVSPNPVSDVLSIRSSVAIESAELIDIAGKNHPVPISENTIDMNVFAPGAYLVRLTTATGAVSVQRVIKH